MLVCSVTVVLDRWCFVLAGIFEILGKEVCPRCGLPLVVRLGSGQQGLEGGFKGYRTGLSLCTWSTENGSRGGS